MRSSTRVLVYGLGMTESRRTRLLSVAMRSVGLAAVSLLVAGVAAAFAAQPKAGGLYEGSESGCTAEVGFTCVFLFRVSSNGRSMSFVATHNVPGAWACRGGGGEAILGPYAKPFQGQPVPSVTISSGGVFTGKQSFGSGKARGSVVATGRFTGTGATATIEFTLNPGPHSCVNGPMALTLG